jgi:hypothetical protein
MFSTPSLKKGNSKLQSSPSSVTSVGIAGELTLSPEAFNFIQTEICSEDDPCLVIPCIQDGVMDSLFEANGNQILNLPNPPPFLDTTSPE